MEFQEITESEYQLFWETHPLKSFLSAPEISKVRKNTGWKTNYVGIKENHNVVAATMLLSHQRHFGKKEFYSPRGYLIDFNNPVLVKYFTKELKKYIKAKNGYVLRIDPYVIYKQRDKEGNTIIGGKDHSKVVKELKKLGYLKVSSKKQEQVSWMFSLDLKNKTKEQILKEMKPNTRNIIRQTEKRGIQLKELSYNELNLFHNMMEKTGKRKGFQTRNLTYYQEMYKQFHEKGQIKFILAEIDLKNYIIRLQEDIEMIKIRLKETKYNEKNRRKQEEKIQILKRRIQEIRQVIEEEGQEKVFTSGAMFILIKPEIVYLMSGNEEKYKKFHSQYLIQWEFIKEGLKKDFQKYNFYGIPINIQSHPKNYGIYEFKKGFNGYVEELIGEFELPITWHYILFWLVQRLKGER